MFFFFFCLDPFGLIWTHFESFGPIWTHLYPFHKIQIPVSHYWSLINHYHEFLTQWPPFTCIKSSDKRSPLKLSAHSCPFYQSSYTTPHMWMNYAAFRLTCRLPHCRFDDICSTAQAPLAAEGWPSGKQRQANRSITLPICPPRQIADSWILFNSGAMPLGDKAKVALPLRAVGCTPPKNISPSPTLQFGGVFCIDVDQGSLINKKKWKIALACLFFVVDALIWCLSQQISVKKAFLSRTERFGSFLFCFFYSNLGLPSAKSLQNERLGSCPVAEKSSR